MIRHPEVLASSASVEGRRPLAGPHILRGSPHGAAHRAARTSGWRV